MNKQSGITLIEVLAALTLVSLIFALVIGIVINSQNNFERQQSINLNTADMTILLNKITSEVRKNPDAISVNIHELKINEGSESSILYIFDSETSTLLRNGIPQSSNITNFTLVLENTVLTIAIEDFKSKIWETRIVLRRGTE